MDQLSFAQQLIDDFDMDQLGLDIVPFVKQEKTRELATCSMAAQLCTPAAGSSDNGGSGLSRAHSPQPEPSHPSPTDPVTVKEEFTTLGCHKWTEGSTHKNMNFLEMCAAEILCPEAGVLGKPFADKVLTECVKSVTRSEGLQIQPRTRDATLSLEMLTPEVLSPVSESSSRRASTQRMEESDTDISSENSSDTVFLDSQRPAPSECGLDTPPDTPPDTPVPPPELTRPSKRTRSRGVFRSIPIEISDYDLINLPVRELNKRLQGFSKDQIGLLKQKRRTLKNRGYAQNCRSKRIIQKHELESMNKNLYEEIDKLKKRLLSASRERDFYKQRCEMLQSEVSQAMKGSSGSQQRKLPPFSLLTDAGGSL